MLIGEIAPSERFGSPLYDMIDEVVANQTGLLFTSHPNDAINGSYGINQFRMQGGPNGVYQFLNGEETQLSINTPLSTLRNYAGDNTPISPANVNTNNANITTGDAMRSVNNQLMKMGKEPRYRFGEYLKK